MNKAHEMRDERQRSGDASAGYLGRSRFIDRLARIVTEVFYAPLVAAVLLALLSAHTTTSFVDFLRWWLLPVLFLGVIPAGFVVLLLQRGRVSDLTVTRASERPLPMAGAILSFGVGTLILAVLGAPREILGVPLSAAVGMLVALPITHRIKVSMHTASLAGSVVILAIAMSPWFLLVGLVVPLIGWAKVRIAHHTVGQVVAGAAIGAAAAAVGFTAMMWLA